jgi:hypothetical protein
MPELGTWNQDRVKQRACHFDTPPKSFWDSQLKFRQYSVAPQKTADRQISESVRKKSSAKSTKSADPM